MMGMMAIRIPPVTMTIYALLCAFLLLGIIAIFTLSSPASRLCADSAGNRGTFSDYYGGSLRSPYLYCSLKGGGVERFIRYALNPSPIGLVLRPRWLKKMIQLESIWSAILAPYLNISA